jgi:hypothetical protein
LELRKSRKGKFIRRGKKKLCPKFKDDLGFKHKVSVVLFNLAECLATE